MDSYKYSEVINTKKIKPNLVMVKYEEVGSSLIDHG